QAATLAPSATSSCSHQAPRSCAAAAAPESASRAPTTTRSPRFVSWRATSNPMPRFAPVTSAVRGCSLDMNLKISSSRVLRSQLEELLVTVAPDGRERRGRDPPVVVKQVKLEEVAAGDAPVRPAELAREEMGGRAVATDHRPLAVELLKENVADLVVGCAEARQRPTPPRDEIGRAECDRRAPGQRRPINRDLAGKETPKCIPIPPVGEDEHPSDRVGHPHELACARCQPAVTHRTKTR